MTKSFAFGWTRVASARAEARLALVQEGRLLDSAGLSAAEQRTLAAWLAAAKFEGAAGATAWPPGTVPPAQSNGFVTFGSFNNFAKVSDETLLLWRAVLEQVPRARLVTRAKVFLF